MFLLASVAQAEETLCHATFPMSSLSPLCMPRAQVKQVDPNLVDVNRFLQSYKSVWDEMVDAWLVIQIGDPQVGKRTQAVSFLFCLFECFPS